MNYIKMLIANTGKSKQDKILEKSKTKHIPFVLSLISICLSAGLSIDRTLRTINDYLPELYRPVFDRVLYDYDSGKSLANAMQHLMADKHLRRIGHLLIETNELGHDVIPSLDVLTNESLNKMRLEINSSIKRLPITMLFPLVLCILPAFVLVGIAPIVIEGFTSINW